MDHAERSQLDAAAWDRLLAPCSSPGRALSHERLAGKRVLITGAAGSIGSALRTVQEQMFPRPSRCPATKHTGITDRYLKRSKYAMIE